jgi:hypothetical protein
MGVRVIDVKFIVGLMAGCCLFSGFWLGVLPALILIEGWKNKWEYFFVTWIAVAISFELFVIAIPWMILW